MLLLERDEKQRQHEEKLRQDAKEDKAELRREMQQQMQQELQRMQQQVVELRRELAPVPKPEVVSEEQMHCLCERIERIHAAKLWTDEELYVIQDTLSDFIEIKAQVSGGVVTQDIAEANPVAGAVKHLVALSVGLPNDAFFSRQVKRKFM